MNLDIFGVWLHGWTELNGEKKPTQEQWNMIVEHLNLCFNKVTKPLINEDVEPIDLGDSVFKDIIEKMKKKEFVEPPSPYIPTPYILPKNPYDNKPDPLYPQPNIICKTTDNVLNVKLCKNVNIDSLFPKDGLSDNFCATIKDE